MLTDVDRDGMGTGFDLEVLKREWSVPVVLAGGCGKLDHVLQAFNAGADGVAISSMFIFSDKSPIKLRSWLVSEGCNVRDV
jgi:cyclase